VASGAERGIGADVERLPSAQVGEAPARLGKGDDRCRFVLDLAGLGWPASGETVAGSIVVGGHDGPVRILFEAEVPVHYGYLFLSAVDEQPELMATRAGQRNGLCGAAVPGVLSMVTGLHTGRVPLAVRWHDAEPPLGPDWEDVVEVAFAPGRAQLVLASFEHFYEVELPAAGSLRARYCAIGMDAARARDTVLEGEPIRGAAVQRHRGLLASGGPGGAGAGR
jgi:hypothetical protein